MRGQVLLVAAVSAVVLAGCGGKMDVSEKNFGAAIDQYLAKKGNACLSAEQWPVQMNELAQKANPQRLVQMEAMAVAGLVKAADVEAEEKDLFGKATGKMTTEKHFALTDAAKPYLQDDTSGFRAIGGNGSKLVQLCWGKMALDKVVKWEGPIKLGEYQEAGVSFTYKFDKVADWASKPEMQAAFPRLKQAMEGVGKTELRKGVKLTSEGWEAVGA